MRAPKVSVLMLTYNRPQFIGPAIESVLAQRLKDWELVVVHDGPNEEIQGIMAEWEKRDPRIRYFHRPVAGNIGEASNFGIHQARGNYIAVLDDDDLWASPYKLTRQTDFLDRHPEYVGCGSGVIVVDTSEHEQMRYLKPERDEDIKRRALIANPIAHSSAIYRRAAALEAGGYDETLAGFQDWDLWLKLGARGRLYNLPEYFACYRIWPGSGSFRVMKNNTRSALRITRRHRHSYPGFAPAFALTLLYHAYAHMPQQLQRYSYSFLSRMKKVAFSWRPAQV